MGDRYAADKYDAHVPVSMEYNDVLARATEGPAFSNGSSFEVWEAEWCAVCSHEPHCPLLAIAFTTDKTPVEWERVPGSLQDYHCSQFDGPTEE